MNDTVLNIGLREYRLDRLRKAGQIVSAGDQYILYAAVTKAVENVCPELRALILADPHSKNIFSTAGINAECNVDRLLYGLTFTADMVVDRIKKHDCIHAFQRTLLIFFPSWKYLIDSCLISSNDFTAYDRDAKHIFLNFCVNIPLHFIH